MTSQDIMELRSICSRLHTLEERLRCSMVGDKPITKATAADELTELRLRIVRVYDPDERRDYYRPVPDAVN